jgi:hypothetical protein
METSSLRKRRVAEGKCDYESAGDWPGHPTRGPRPSSTRPAGNIICGEKFNFKLCVWLVNGARLEIKRGHRVPVSFFGHKSLIAWVRGRLTNQLHGSSVEISARSWVPYGSLWIMQWTVHEGHYQA